MAKVYVVHRVDTEGPLNETLEATFARIRSFTGGGGTLSRPRKIYAKYKPENWTWTAKKNWPSSFFVPAF